MARPSRYSPLIGRFLVCVLYHEARSRGIPMTVLVDLLLRDALSSGKAWRQAEEAFDPQGEQTTTTTRERKTYGTRV